MSIATIVIPTRKPENYGPLVESILKNEPGITPDKIVVVLDGCPKLDLPVTYIEGAKPFIFSRNVNLGIRQAAGDVIVLNDDTELVTPKGFTRLSEDSTRNGITSAKIDGVGRWDADKFCAFVAVFIPKEVQDKVGLLDTQFVNYGYEDNDFCRRVIQSGLHINRCDDCVVKHFHPDRSSFHGPNGTYSGDNLVTYNRKYKIAYQYTWPEHLEQLAELNKSL